MKVKFLRDLGEDKKGHTREVDDQKGQYWIQMGLVESADGKESKKVHTPVKKAIPKKSKGKR